MRSIIMWCLALVIVFFKQKTSYELRISDWSSDVCSSDLHVVVVGGGDAAVHEALVLARTSRRVTMICRGPLRAKRDDADRLAARENVEFVRSEERRVGKERVSTCRSWGSPDH